MSIYLAFIYGIAGFLIAAAILCMVIIVGRRSKLEKITISGLKQKSSTLYIKYNIKTKEMIINNKYSYLDLEISKYIVEYGKSDDFCENIQKIAKDNTQFSFETKLKEKTIYFNFEFREKYDNFIVIRCDYNEEKNIENIIMKSIDDIKKVHNKHENKNACLYYLNVRDFSSVNQRYGQKCGDYILEKIKTRLSKMEKNNISCCYLGADKFAVYYNSKSINKKKAINLSKEVNRKLTKPIDIGGINVDLDFGIGLCLGKYDDLSQFVKGAYIASNYAQKRKEYHIVIYNDKMKLEDDMMENCEKELETILTSREININYNPVFYHLKSKFVGYISNPIFSNSIINYNILKALANQHEKCDEFVATIIDNQLISFLKKRPKKRSKLFIKLTLEELPLFLEIYLSNPAYSDCKIVILLNVKKGYEMLNKFSYISGTISKIVEEGIELALEINYSNMYNYDYILTNATYLILDETIINNINNTIIRNKFLNVLELAKTYDLELIATNVQEYIQFESLLKYDVHYFTGSYFGKSANKPNEIEQSKTKIFAKFINDSKKNKKK